MARAEFEYDEVGNTFYYVLLSFYAIILLPSTYFFFPSDKEEAPKVDDKKCHCDGCLEKLHRKNASKPWRKTRKIISIVVLAVAWVILAILVHKVINIENTHQEYDPYSILELDQGAPTSEVKKAYRELSKKYHPDKGGDPILFDRIAKAYQALTDEEARENWEKYGSPDGPTATTFGIALPKWIVSKEYGVWVLAFYGLVFMVILPVIVGMWWYNSIKYNVDKVLLDTTQLFGYFIRKTPRMEIHRALMVLGGAFEFNKEYNAEIILRPTDDVDLPRLIKQLPNLGENKKERPLCLPYSLKARILMYAHLERLTLDIEGLIFDQRYTLTRCYRLIEEMISISQQISYYTPTKVPLETFDNLLKLMSMLVQAQWPRNSPLMQLPHLDDRNIPYIRRQKVVSETGHNMQINTCADLAKISNDRRRQILNSLSDQQYRDVVVVLTSMPRLIIENTFEVPGEDDAHEVTAGCFVLLKVKLTRRSLLDPAVAGEVEMRMKEFADSDDEAEEEEREEDAPPTPDDAAQKKRKVWEKPQQKKKGGAKKKAAKVVPKKTAAAPAAPPTPVAAPDTPSTSAETGKEKEKEEKKKKPKKAKEEEGDEIESDVTQSGSDTEERESEEGNGAPANEEESDDDGWVAETKKPVLEAKSYETHPVHCPFYPGEKFEWWWLVLTTAEKKGQRRLVAPVTHCKTLVDSQTVELRFPAPEQKGTFMLNLAVHSDSYVDCDYSIDLKLEVKEAKEVVLPKYEDTEEEEEEAASSSDDYTEESDDE